MTTPIRSAAVDQGEAAAVPIRPITFRQIPESRPPECHASHAELMAAERQVTPYVQDALAVDFSLATDEQLFGHQPTVRADLPEPREWSAQLARSVIEVLDGNRSPAQLVRWTTPQVHAVVARRHAVAMRRAREGLGPRSRRSPVVRRVMVCEPADGVAEVSVVVVHDGRVRAMAMRLVGQDGRWRLTVLHVG